MALNDKKTGFGFDMDEKFKKVTGKKEDETEKGTSKTQTSDNKPLEAKQEHEHDYTHTHDDVVEPKQQERKQKRVQLLTYESLIARMDKYAAKRGVSRAAVFEAAMIAFLDKVDPIDKK